MNACGGMGGKGQTATKWNDNRKKSLRSNRTYVNMSKRCISPSLWQIGRRQVPYKVRLIHKEPRKHYWLTKRNKSRCSPQWSIWTTLWKKKVLFTTWNTPQAVLLPTTFDRGFLPFTRWKTSNFFFTNFGKPFVTGVKSRDVARFRLSLYFTVVNFWRVSANIPCKAWYGTTNQYNYVRKMTLAILP